MTGSFAFGGFGSGGGIGAASVGASPSISGGGFGSGNSMTTGLEVASIAAALGIINQGNISAVAKANNIKNASIDISATAAGNIHQVTQTGANGVVIGDLTQFQLQQTSRANASARNLNVSGYSNMGNLTNGGCQCVGDGHRQPVEHHEQGGRCRDAQQLAV